MLPGETILSGANFTDAHTFRVCSSAAGYFIGTQDKYGPHSRESEYFPNETTAQVMLTDWEETCIEYMTAGIQEMPTGAALIPYLRLAYRDGKLPGARV